MSLLVYSALAGKIKSDSHDDEIVKFDVILGATKDHEKDKNSFVGTRSKCSSRTERGRVE